MMVGMVLMSVRGCYCSGMISGSKEGHGHRPMNEFEFVWGTRSKSAVNSAVVFDKSDR